MAIAARRPLVALLSATLFFAAGFAAAAPAAATADPASAPAPAPATPTAGAAASQSVTDVVLGIGASEDLQRASLARLEQAGRWREWSDRVEAQQAGFDAFPASAAATGELVDTITRARRLRALHGEAATSIDELAAAARQLQHDRRALEADARKWHEGSSLLQGLAVPAPVQERTVAMEVRIQATIARVREHQNFVLVALDRAVALQARIEDARAMVAAQEAGIRARRIRLEESSLRQVAAAPARFDVVKAEVATAWRSLAGYLARDVAHLAGFFFGALALTGWLFAREPRDAPPPQRAYGHPMAASLLIALMVLWWLAPDPPTLFYEVMLMLLPIPAAVVARGALATTASLTLYGIALATMLIPLRAIIEASPLADRILLLLQAASIGVPVALDLRHGRLQTALRWASPGTVRGAALFVLAEAAVTVFHVFFGFTGPGRSLRAGMGSILGFSLVFGSTAVAVYGAILALLASPLFRWLRSARDADPAMLRTIRQVLGLLAILGVVIVTLGMFGLGPRLLLAAQSLNAATLEVGTVSVAVNAIVTALGLAIATVVLTGLTGFLLDREIVPRLSLRPGAGYAIVTFTRWAIVITGAVLTLASLGIDMTKITLLASAVGVGIGFGLQNVVNNFISGLIIIVERPVGVGDLIEVGTLSGEVMHIGIRASIVRTEQGAEVVVPNGELVSKEVVNWTRSDRQRRYDIDVDVAPDSDPERVMRVLAEAAGDVPDIMTSPAPRVMFKGFSGSALNFTLLAWVPTVDVELQVQNALRVAILRQFAAAGIVIRFPGFDLHVQAAGEGARPAAG